MSSSSSNAQVEENAPQPSEAKKRKITKWISFEVVRVCEDDKKGRYSLKLVKPSSKIDFNTCPTVCLKEERADNERAFHIMHNFRHKNILSLKLLDKHKMQNNDSLAAAAFVEPYDGELLSICLARQCADNLYHVPSSEFQSYIRQIVSGLDFLMKNGLYHGNLTWDSTLYHGNTVKLAGFKMKESMNVVEAMWDDWLGFRKMLEEVLKRAQQLNNTSSDGFKYYCGNLESLIDKMKTLNCTSLSVIKEIILEDPFFWDFTKRVKFFATTVSLKLSDVCFMNKVKNSSLCKKPWDEECTQSFCELVKQMNDYRESESNKAKQNRRRWGRESRHGGNEMLPYNGNSVEDYVRCICGAYTHRRQIGVACLFNMVAPFVNYEEDELHPFAVQKGMF